MSAVVEQTAVSDLRGVTTCCCTLCGFVPDGNCLHCSAIDQVLCCQRSFRCKICAAHPTCLKATNNCCFVDCRGAFPPDQDTPCAYAVCGQFLIGSPAEPLGIDGNKLPLKLFATWALPCLCCQTSLGGQPYPDGFGCSNKVQCCCCCEVVEECAPLSQLTCCKVRGGVE